MKNKFIFCGLLLTFLGISFPGKAQNNITITANSNEHLKTVSEARTLAFSNTFMPIAVGMGSVALFKDKTLQSIGAVMTVYGIIMGPSTGNFYANDYARGGLGMATRLV